MSGKNHISGEQVATVGLAVEAESAHGAHSIASHDFCHQLRMLPSRPSRVPRRPPTWDSRQVKPQAMHHHHRCWLCRSLSTQGSAVVPRPESATASAPSAAEQSRARVRSVRLGPRHNRLQKQRQLCLGLKSQLRHLVLPRQSMPARRSLSTLLSRSAASEA